MKPKLQIVRDDGPKAQNKILRATLGGKEKAFERIVSEVESRDPNNACERVLLMDGERALEKKLEEYLIPKGFVIVLDLLHVGTSMDTMLLFLQRGIKRISTMGEEISDNDTYRKSWIFYRCYSSNCEKARLLTVKGTEDRKDSQVL